MNLLWHVNREIAKIDRTVSPHCHVSFINADGRYAPAQEAFAELGQPKPVTMPIALTPTRGSEGSSSMAAVAEAPLLTDAQIAVISSQMGLTPVDFDVARWVSPSRGRTCDDHGVMYTGPA